MKREDIYNTYEILGYYSKCKICGYEIEECDSPGCYCYKLESKTKMLPNGIINKLKNGGWEDISTLKNGPSLMKEVSLIGDKKVYMYITSHIDNIKITCNYSIHSEAAALCLFSYDINKEWMVDFKTFDYMFKRLISVSILELFEKVL